MSELRLGGRTGNASDVRQGVYLLEAPLYLRMVVECGTTDVESGRGTVSKRSTLGHSGSEWGGVRSEAPTGVGGRSHRQQRAPFSRHDVVTPGESPVSEGKGQTCWGVRVLGWLHRCGCVVVWFASRRPPAEVNPCRLRAAIGS